MPRHYQFPKLRLNLEPSTTAHVDYAKYLLGILDLLKIFYTVGPIIHTKKKIIVNTINIATRNIYNQKRFLSIIKYLR